MALSACGASAPVRPGSAKPDAAADLIARLQQESQSQAERVTELEARIALIEAEAREWRRYTEAPRKSTETVHIGAARKAEDAGQEIERVPLVRLHETGPDLASASFDVPLVLPPRPAGVDSRLPVVPLPEQRASRLRGPVPKAAEDDARERYREALRALRERRFDESGEALAAFLDTYPAHALSAGAMYWLGEVRYAQRRYADALRQFQAVLQVFPDSAKRAGSLLKAGLCQKRLGDQGAAKRYFEQLREQFPNSDAARIASREGSS